MTTPRVTELPRRLEPVGPDTFLGAVVLEFPQPVARAGNVIALRPPDAIALQPPDAIARIRPRSPQSPHAA